MEGSNEAGAPSHWDLPWSHFQLPLPWIRGSPPTPELPLWLLGSRSTQGTTSCPHVLRGELTQRRKRWSSHIKAAFATHNRQPLPIAKNKSSSLCFLPQGGLFLSIKLSDLSSWWHLNHRVVHTMAHLWWSFQVNTPRVRPWKTAFIPAVLSWLCTTCIWWFNCWQITHSAPVPTKTSAGWIPGGSLVSMQTFPCLHCFRGHFSAFKTQGGKEHQPLDCSRGL